MKGKVRRFRITGLDEGYPITPYIVETDYRGDIDIHLETGYRDSVRYYEELKGYEKKKKEKENE